MSMTSTNYRDLLVWQKSMDLAAAVYELTSSFPQSEVFGLAKQMRCAAVSISSNLAEGSKRGTKKDFRRFVTFAYGSGAELETQRELSERFHYGSLNQQEKAKSLLSEVMRMLNRLTIALNQTKNY